MLKKIKITLVDTEAISKRNLYYKLNNYRNLNQIPLIEDYLQEKGFTKEWEEIKKKYFKRKGDDELFLKDFFITKFNYKKFDITRLYESFVNYFETMSKYMQNDVLMQKLEYSAQLYCNILNVNFSSDTIKKAFIKVKKHSGEDTYAYILEIYEDYTNGNLSEDIFIEILNTISEYLKNREKTSNNTDFNELVQYLNAFITCK